MKLIYKVDLSGITLRQWIKQNFPNIHYDALQQSLRNGDIRVNNSRVSPQYILNESDVIKIWSKLTINDYNERTLHPKTWKDIKLIDETQDFWVIDKPYGIPSQCGTNINVSIIEIMQSWMKQKVYIVHRLDRCTTGLMVIAKDSYAARDLSMSLQNREWKKDYIAKLDGVLPKKSGTLYGPVDSKESITKYEIIQNENNYTIVRFTPITGRKHQIRKHAADFLAPLAGDNQYGSECKTRIELRCVSLSFTFRQKNHNYSLKSG